MEEKPSSYAELLQQAARNRNEKTQRSPLADLDWDEFRIAPQKIKEPETVQIGDYIIDSDGQIRQVEKVEGDTVVAQPVPQPTAPSIGGWGGLDKSTDAADRTVATTTTTVIIEDDEPAPAIPRPSRRRRRRLIDAADLDAIEATADRLGVD